MNYKGSPLIESKEAEWPVIRNSDRVKLCLENRSYDESYR